MRIVADVCGCFPTNKYYPGIAERLSNARTFVAGLARGFSGDVDWAREPFVVIDFETTGLNPAVDRVVEVGFAIFERGELSYTQNWLVNPGIPIPEDSTAITGITDEMVKDSPSFAAVWKEAETHLHGRIPVAYNYAFDSAFLRNEVMRLGIDPKNEAVPPAVQDDCVYIDPLVWAREIQRDQKGFKLTDVAARLGIALDQAHRASHDAEATGKVLLELASKMPPRYGDLIRVQTRYAATQNVEMSWFRR